MTVKSRDIDVAQNSAKKIFNRIKYFILWFLGFFGFLSMNTHCPCCGQAVCPVGAGVIALMSGFFAFVVQFGKSLFYKVKAFFVRIKNIVLDML